MLKKLILLIFSLLIQASIFAEGLAPTTKIYTNYGLLEMQELQQGMEAVCLTDSGEFVFSEIVRVEKVEANTLYTFTVNEKKYCIAGSQLFYCVNRKAWVKLCNLNTKKDFIIVNFDEVGQIKDIKEKLPAGVVYDHSAKSIEDYIKTAPLCKNLEEKRFVYKISVKDHHTFFIDGGILCHNFLFVATPLYCVYGAELGLIVLEATLATIASYAVTSAAETIIKTLNKPTHKPSDQASPCQTLNQPQEKIIGCETPLAELIDTSKPSCGKPDSDLNKPLILSQPIPEPQSGIICEGLPIEQATPTILSCENHGGRKIGDTIPADAPPVSIGYITSEGIPYTDKGTGVSTVFEKPECTQEGLELDFYRLKPTNIRLQINKAGLPVLIGTLPDGRTITARVDSSDGRPTLELQDGILRTKIRYSAFKPKGGK